MWGELGEYPEDRMESTSLRGLNSKRQSLACGAMILFSEKLVTINIILEGNVAKGVFLGEGGYFHIKSGERKAAGLIIEYSIPRIRAPNLRM